MRIIEKDTFIGYNDFVFEAENVRMDKYKKYHVEGEFAMSLIKCPECNREISDTVKKCPNCGYNIKRYFHDTNTNKETHKLFIMIVIIVLCIAIVCGVLLLIGRGSLKTAINIIQTGSFACIQSHDLEDATCEHGQICKRCGSEVGQPTDHKWLDATCEHGQICVYCNLEEGEKADHKWLAATCISPQICDVCGKEEGDALGHSCRMGYCENCGEYINELQDSYDMLVTAINDAWDLINESLDKMALTTSYYDTTYVAEANKIDYELQGLLYDAADVAYQYDEFYDIGKDLHMAGARLYLFDSLTSDTGFGSYEYMTSMANSLANCANSLGNAQEALKKYAR